MRKVIVVPLLALLALTGCNKNPGKNPDPVDVTGRVTQGGMLVSDVTFNLQVTRSGLPASFPVKGGEFKGKATPGRYTWFISEGANPALLRSIPAKYRSGDKDREVDVKEGATLTITLD